MRKAVIILGCLDSKGEEYGFIKKQIEKEGIDTLLIDVGVIGEPQIRPDITNIEVARAAGADLIELKRDKPTREKISPLMAEGAKRIVLDLVNKGKVHGIISCGGTQGTTLATYVMRSLPIGFPKVMVSTMAAGNTKDLVGIKDIVMIPAVADIMGLNKITRIILREAASAISGMVKMEVEKPQGIEKQIIAITTVGITTPAAMMAKDFFIEKGYDTVVFHAVGSGGNAMENLIREGHIDGVFDLATIEVVQQMLGGYLAAAPDRMTAAIDKQIPVVFAPGAVSCNTYGPPETIPEKFKGRPIAIHSPMFTNVRTSKEELIALAKEQAKRVNSARGPVAWFVPIKGFCQYSVEGGPLYDPEADKAYLQTLKEELRSDIPIFVRKTDINDPAFALEMAEYLLKMMKGKRKKSVNVNTF